MENIKLMYQIKPEFIKDVLNLHYFKTVIYYDKRMNDFPKLNISSELKVAFLKVRYAKSYTIENEMYNFQFFRNNLGIPKTIPFPILFNDLFRIGFKAIDINDMYYRFYKSENAMIIKLAEDFKKEDNTFSEELLEFIKRKECNPFKNWNIEELLEGNWNYTLLAINQRVWETAFDINYLNNIFHIEKNEIDKIDADKLYSNEFENYYKRIEAIIEEKLTCLY